MFVKNPEYFLTIVKERSISRAAERLYLSQPYLSQYLSKLERELEVVLLDRSHSPLRLTRAGELFYAYLDRQSYLDRQLLNDLRELRSDRRPELHIGMVPWRGAVLLPDILPLFEAKYPDVQLVLHEVSVSDMEELAAANTIDFCVMQIPSNMEKLTHELVMREYVLLVGHKDQPLFRGLDSPFDNPRHFPDLRLLEGERLILLPPNWNMSMLLWNTFTVHGVEPRNTLVTINTTTAINLAVARQGFAFVQESGVARFPLRDQLACFTVGEPPLTHSLTVVYKKNGFLSPAARTFIDLIKEFYGRGDRSNVRGCSCGE